METRCTNYVYTTGICFLVGIFTAQATKDVVFVLDRSGSVDASEVADALEFIYNVTEWLTIGTKDTQISLVTFSDDVKEEFKLSSHPNKTEILSVIYGLRGMKSGGGTYTYDALRYVLSSSFTVLNGGRTNAGKAVVVMTDGASHDLSLTLEMADQLRNDLGAEVYSIGIGDSIDIDELSAISSDPYSYYGLSVHDYIYLFNLVPALVPKLDETANATLSKGCPDPTKSTTTTPPLTRNTAPATTTTIPTTTSTISTTTAIPTTTSTLSTTTAIPTTTSTLSTTTTTFTTTSTLTSSAAIPTTTTTLTTTTPAEFDTIVDLYTKEISFPSIGLAVGILFGLLGVCVALVLYFCLRKRLNQISLQATTTTTPTSSTAPTTTATMPKITMTPTFSTAPTATATMRTSTTNPTSSTTTATMPTTITTAVSFTSLKTPATMPTTTTTPTFPTAPTTTTAMPTPTTASTSFTAPTTTAAMHTTTTTPKSSTAPTTLATMPTTTTAPSFTTAPAASMPTTISALTTSSPPVTNATKKTTSLTTGTMAREIASAKNVVQLN